VFRQAKLFKSKNYALFDECIRDAVATVTPNILQATWNEVSYRLDICRATMGANVETYSESYMLRKNL
jgi:hypothetical protein